MIDPRVRFMLAAIRLAQDNVRRNSGGPFGCVIVKGGKIISRARNSVTKHHDPTAHAEIIAIRKACRKLKTFQLQECELYCSCEPCPMCLGAIYWARPSRVFYATTREDAAAAGFDDDFIYHEILIAHESRKIRFTRLEVKSALSVFDEWKQKADKISY
ncbi:MAG: nucleoside deaminase [Chitinophagales bacterium]